MSIIAAAVRHLMAAGVTGEALIAAIEDMEAEMAPLAKVQTPGAIRQERYRQRHKVSQNVTTVTGDVTSVTEPPPLSRPPNENISNPPTHTPPDITSRARADDFPRLECASPAVWRDFLKNRAKKNLTNTASAHRKLVRELEAMAARTGWPPGKVFESCVEQGWGAIYETNEMKGADSARSNQNIRAGNGNGADKRSGLARALDAGIANLDAQLAALSN